jgi:AmiR/NasT family two-component response regulator
VPTDHELLAERLTGLLTVQATIAQAQGVIMARLQCSEEQAFAAIVAMSQTPLRTLAEVAAEVLTQADTT